MTGRTHKRCGSVMWLVVVAAWLWGSSGAEAAAAASQGLKLKSSDEVSKTGFFRLSWGLPDGQKAQQGGAEFILKQSKHPDMSSAVIAYTGAAKARVLSGLTDGAYYFRVTLKGGASSPILRVDVEHYPLSMAWIFLSLGALVFFATAGLIIVGHRKAGRESEGADATASAEGGDR